MKKWAHNMPNDGLIRYYIVGNLERVFPTSTAALREILVNKAYDFAKPRTIQQFLYPIVGHGLLLAEGEEHKVRRDYLSALCLHSLTFFCSGPTQKLDASVLVPPHQRSLPNFLGQELRDGEKNRTGSAAQRAR